MVDSLLRMWRRLAPAEADISQPQLSELIKLVHVVGTSAATRKIKRTPIVDITDQSDGPRTEYDYHELQRARIVSRTSLPAEIL